MKFSSIEDVRNAALVALVNKAGGKIEIELNYYAEARQHGVPYLQIDIVDDKMILTLVKNTIFGKN